MDSKLRAVIIKRNRKTRIYLTGAFDMATPISPVLEESTLLQHTRLFDVMSERYIHGGRHYERVIIKHPGAVVILPRDPDGNFLLVRQYRWALKQWILEFPAGTLEPGEDAVICAKRELAEEAGRAAELWIPLGELYPTPGICNEKQYLFYATNLRDARGELDEDELLQLELFSLADLEAAINDGRLSDAKSIALFTRARLRGLV